MKIIEATKEEINSVSYLFDLYRQFNGQESDLEKAHKFIEQRLTKNDSVIFLAQSEANETLGFVQLYPSFSSVAMRSIWLLNDLYVTENSRKQGIAKSLLQHVQSYAKSTKATTVKLATAVDNLKAKSLYEAEGYTKITAFDHYTQKVPDA